MIFYNEGFILEIALWIFVSIVKWCWSGKGGLSGLSILFFILVRISFVDEIGYPNSDLSQ